MVRGRPTICRRVASLPQATYFRPAGVPIRMLEELCLSVDEAEAIRLNDLEGLEQEEGADKMGISRPTFQRILALARRKVADALLNGKAIRMEGGNFELALQRFRCAEDGHEWDVPFESQIAAPPESCPECETPGVVPLSPPGMGSGWRHRRGHTR